MRDLTLNKNIHSGAHEGVLRIGFVPLIDSAPIIVAKELGFFRNHGLSVQLSREVGWATIRDKVIFGELDAVHAPGPMVMSTTLGLGCRATPCMTALVLSTNGNAITFSEHLRSAGVVDGATLRDSLKRTGSGRGCVFGVVFAHSAHRIILGDWLRAAGIDSTRDVQIVLLPPAQLFRNLAAGTIDGFCAGEPWNSLAVAQKIGWCAALSTDLAPGHPEKVLMLREDVAARRHEEHVELIAAISEAAAMCDDPEFRPELARILARREYLNLSETAIAGSLTGTIDFGYGRTIEAKNFIQFSNADAGRPTQEKAAWLLNGLRRNGLIPSGVEVDDALTGQTFRADIFAVAQNRIQKTNHYETVL